MKLNSTGKIIIISAVSIVSASIVLLVTLTIFEINNQNLMAQYKDHYESALESHTGSERGIDLGLDLFEQTYADLAHADTAAKVNRLYADELYFNDTVTTIRSVEELTSYMQKTSDKLKHSSVTIDQVIRDGVDVFVRWSMHFESAAYGVTVDSNTIGMTHLRFNDRGQVVLHQDFWDSTAGIYSQLPVVGFFVRRAQDMLE